LQSEELLCGTSYTDGMQARGWEILPPINLSILVDDVHKDLAQVDGRGPGGKGFVHTK